MGSSALRPRWGMPHRVGRDETLFVRLIRLKVTMNHLSKDLERWFTKLRAEWFRTLRPMGNWVPWELRDMFSWTSDGKKSHSRNRA